MISVGIIGGGVLGKAHANVLRHYFNVKVYDLEPARATHSLRDVLQQDVIFVCVPTPMRKDGTVEPQIVFDVLHAIESESPCKAVVLKSTLPPAALLECDKIVPGRFIFSPEFLTERSAEYELQQSTYFIFGENRAHIKALSSIEELFHARWPGVPRHWASLETAGLVKYMRNTFFAVKVGLLNEFDAVLRTFEAERSKALELFMLDPRIGRSHFQVPGHDGTPGWGGSCFLKDVNGFIHIAREQGSSCDIVQAAWRSNVERRGPDTIALELGKMVGRAITEAVTPAEVEKLGA